MKLWQQGLIILGFPLLLQLVFASVLIDSLLKIESAAESEAKAKRILATCQDLRILVFHTVTVESASRYLSAEQTVAAREQLVRKMPGKIKELLALTASDKQASSIAKNFAKTLNEFLELVSYAQVRMSEPRPVFVLTRFANEHEYMEEMLVTMSNLVADDQALHKLFGKEASEFKPESVSRRQRTVTLVIWAVIADAALVSLLSVIFARKTLARLKVLMNNIKLFTDRKTNLERLQGQDELAELDRAFREMAGARSRAEDFRSLLMEMVTHDLRSPLSSNAMTLSMLMQTVAPKIDQEELKKFRRVNSEMRRLLRLSDSILSVEKMEAGQLQIVKEEVFVEDLVDASLSAVRGIAELKDLQIETEYEEDLSVFCDRDRTIQVLVNLLSNSVKFSPEGASIRIRAFKNEDAQVRLETIDQGPGISAEQQQFLFKRFSQLDQPQNIKGLGSGLGLYISKLIIDAQGGRIGVTSASVQPDEQPKQASPGTCFWFELPLNDATPVQ